MRDDREKVRALAVDFGTGSARAFLFDPSGERSVGVRVRYGWRVTPAGGVEADPDELVRLACAVVDAAVKRVPSGTRIGAVGFSMLWHTLLGLDARQEPVTPVYGWNDTRATEAVRALRARLDEREVHARTGVRLHPSYPFARLVWLREARPRLFARVRWWLSFPEYLWLRLTGQRTADLSIAAGTGLLDRARMAWDEELLGVAGVEISQLSPISLDDAVAIRPESGVAAERWPGLRAAVWRQPVGDGACACLGSGCLNGDGVALGIGTSAAVRTLVRLEAAFGPRRRGSSEASSVAAASPSGLWCYRLDRDRTLLGGAISNGGAVRDWLRAVLRLPEEDPERLDALLAERPPAAHGLRMLPFLAGERSPHWPLGAAATLTGLRLGTSPLDILQAGMEAVTYRLVLLRRLLRRAAPDAGTIVASGGALRHSAYWPQLLADALGEPLRLARDPETSSRGAAMLALRAAGVLDDLAAMPPPDTVSIEPDPERHAAHAAALDRQLALERRFEAGT